MKRFFLILNIFLMTFPALAEGWKFDYAVNSVTSAGTGAVLPFWARTVQGGYMPDVSSTLVTGGADILYTSPKELFFGAGANLVGTLTSPTAACGAKV